MKTIENAIYIKQPVILKEKYFLTTVTFCCLLSILNFTGCKKLVQIPPPNSQVVAATAFNNNNTATSAQLDIYVSMFTNTESYTLASALGIYSDELTSYSTRPQQMQEYTNSLTASGTLSYKYANWSSYYKYIYQANAVITGLQTTSGTSVAVKQQLTGEAYFVRAFCHFYLSNIYGDVPLVLTTNYQVNSSIKRTPRIQVLQQVIADLQLAKAMLNTNYIDASDTATTTERVRPNKAAALALLARAQLYLGDYSQQNATDYQKADSAATAVINNSNYSLSPLSGVFLANSSEAIWQLETPSGQTRDTYDGDYFILTGAPSTSNTKYTTISPQLMASFEPSDQRVVNWIGSYSSGGITWNFPYKYKDNSLNFTGTVMEYTMMLRLGEQYLIRAEAETHENKFANAVADLNVIRNRAGLPNYTGATDPTSLAAAILHERQVELFSEWGHRWFDLVRTGNVNSVMGSPGNVCQFKGGTWSSSGYQLLFPIPQSDRNADPNLTQNQGY